MGPGEPWEVADIDADLGDLLSYALAEIAAAKGVDTRRLSAGLANGTSLAQALDFPPSVTEILYARAHRWFSLGQYHRAELLFRALCLIDAGRADFWVGFGVCLRLRAALDEALRAFETAADLRPDWALPHFHALELLVRRGEWERAATALAAFEARIDDKVERATIVESARYKTAIEMRIAAQLDESLDESPAAATVME